MEIPELALQLTLHPEDLPNLPDMTPEQAAAADLAAVEAREQAATQEEAYLHHRHHVELRDQD